MGSGLWLLLHSEEIIQPLAHLSHLWRPGCDLVTKYNSRELRICHVTLNLSMYNYQQLQPTWQGEMVDHKRAGQRSKQQQEKPLASNKNVGF